MLLRGLVWASAQGAEMRALGLRNHRKAPGTSALSMGSGDSG